MWLSNSTIVVLGVDKSQHLKLSFILDLKIFNCRLIVLANYLAIKNRVVEIIGIVLHVSILIHPFSVMILIILFFALTQL